MKSIAVVIVNYNGINFQNECISDILKQTYSNYKIIVVDNGSIDGSVESAKKKFKNYSDKIVFIETGMNNGVAKGNNIGIQYSLDHAFDYTLLLNNDTELDVNLFRNLIEDTSDSKVIVPLIYYFSEKNKIWFAGGAFQKNKGLIYHEGINKNDDPIYHVSKFTDYAPTCCMLIDNKVFGEVGLMDEKYFMYYDDTDFCMRLLINDIKIKYEPKAYLWHKVSSSSGGMKSKVSVYYFTRNRFYFLNKYRKEIGLRAVIYSYLVTAIKYMLRFAICKEYRWIKKAYFDYKKKLMYYGNLE